jgi:hypothetical protein
MSMRCLLALLVVTLIATGGSAQGNRIFTG